MSPSTAHCTAARFSPNRPSRLAACRSALASGALLLAGLAVSTQAHPEQPVKPCSAVPLPDSILQRVNEVRLRGAVCHTSEAPAVALPLRWSPALAEVAAAQALDMASRGRMEHVDRENHNLGERLSASGYRFKSAAENLAFGYDSLDEVVDAWLESESHCVNLMNVKLMELGVACSDRTVAAAPGDVRYWTMVLGAPPVH